MPELVINFFSRLDFKNFVIFSSRKFQPEIKKILVLFEVAAKLPNKLGLYEATAHSS